VPLDFSFSPREKMGMEKKCSAEEVEGSQFHTSRDWVEGRKKGVAREKGEKTFPFVTT